MKNEFDYEPTSFAKKVVIFVMLSASIGLASVSKRGPAENVGEKIDSAAHRTATFVDDSSLTTRIKSDILRDHLTKMDTINVTTKNGVVTLSGVVRKQEIIDRAIDIAKSYKSVKSVESNLFVKRI